MDGDFTSATATVVKGGNRTLRVQIPVVCNYPDGQEKYRVMCEGTLVIPAGDDYPWLEVPNPFAITVEEKPRPSVQQLIDKHGPGAFGKPFTAEDKVLLLGEEGAAKWDSDGE